MARAARHRLRYFPRLPLNSYNPLIVKHFHPKRGRLLVAEPLLFDPNFRHTVVLITEFSRHGVVGFILNRLSEFRLNQLGKDLEALPPLPVLWGGPVETNTLHYIHQYKDLPGAQPISPEEHLYWGGDFDVLFKALIKREIDPNRVRFFIGYSGWRPLQLNDELHRESWFILPARQKYVFTDTPNLQLWYRVLKESGVIHRLITLFPPNPMWN